MRIAARGAWGVGWEQRGFVAPWRRSAGSWVNSVAVAAGSDVGVRFEEQTRGARGLRRHARRCKGRVPYLKPWVTPLHRREESFEVTEVTGQLSGPDWTFTESSHRRLIKSYGRLGGLAIGSGG